jgi:hypothetical protein
MVHYHMSIVDEAIHISMSVLAYTVHGRPDQEGARSCGCSLGEPVEDIENNKFLARILPSLLSTTTTQASTPMHQAYRSFSHLAEYK